MKRKIFKILTVVLLLALLTTPNFIYVGEGLVSYAVDGMETNNQNVQFDAKLKEGNILELLVYVKTNGYFTGEINLENSNFTFDTNQSNEYINKLESKKITLNKIEAGTTAQMDLKVLPIKDDYFDVGLFETISRLNITGIYKDDEEKEFEISGTREVEFKYVEENTEEDLENTTQIITNKIIKVKGEEKRVIQLQMNLGLKENNYPIKEIETNIDVPTINGVGPEIVSKIDYNNTTDCTQNYDKEKSILQIKLTNEPKEENKIKWMKTGNEKVVVTFIYDKEAEIENMEINNSLLSANSLQGKLIIKETLYDGKRLENIINLNREDFVEEKDEIINVVTNSGEGTIYKGKLNAGIERQYESKTKIEINLANAEQYIDVKELTEDVVFNKTLIKKDDLKNILGENGQITILDENLETIAIINNQTEVDETGNIVIDYTSKEPTALQIRTTLPVKEGNIELTNTKTIKSNNKETFKEKTELITRTIYKYNDSDQKENISKIRLEGTVTEARIDINRENLSTLTTNNIEIRATLKSSEEKNDLYKNPKLQIILPEEIENIKVNSINKLYADEFKIVKANLGEIGGVGKIINIELEGEQSKFTSQISEGIQIVIDAEITFFKSTPTKQAKIELKYANENGIDLNYETSKDVKIISKNGLFVYTRVDNNNEVLEDISNDKLKLNIATKSEKEKEIVIERTIINNFETNMENVVLTGKLPKIGKLKELNINVDESKIYYLENQNSEWKEDVEDLSDMAFYRINLPNNKILPGQAVKVSYTLTIPSKLENNLKETEILNISFENAGQNISENYSTEFLTTIGMNRNINLAKSALNEKLNDIGEIKISAISQGEELEENQEINEGQTVKVKLGLTNTTEDELKSVRIIAKQQNAIFYDYTVTQEINTLTLEEMDVTYYDEKEETNQKVFTAESIKAGETVEFEYEYSVKEMPGEETKGTIEVSAENKETQTITALKNNIVDADVKVKITNAKNLEAELYADYTYNSKISVKNMSDRELKNIKVEIPLSDYFEDKIELFNNNANMKFEKIENGVAQFNINSLNSGETITDIITYYLKDFEEKEVDIRLSAIAIIDNKTYISNEINRKAYQVKPKISITQEGNIEGNTLKTGDRITYTAIIKNDDENNQKISIYNSMPSELVMGKAYLLRNGKQTEIEVNKTENSVEYETEISGNSEIKFIIEAEVYTRFKEKKEITNVVELYAPMQYLKSNPVTYIINNSEEDEDDPINPSDSDDSEDKDDENSSKETGTIFGTIWLDEDKNGRKDEYEKTLDNIEIRLLNNANNEMQEKTTTDDNGNYKFENINAGKYIIAVKYDTLKYSVTEYKSAEIDETENSDVISKEVNGEILAITDELAVDGNIISNVDAGLTENKIFDLSLNKYISKVTIQNKEGTKLLQYNKEKLAKVEIHAKQINGSNVIVEYGIDIKNEGEIPGYVSEIIDYLPNDFKFSSELNKEWYISTDNELHSTSLSNEIINPGETKTLTLILTKTMTENNTGTSLNTAEIIKTSNDLAIEDIDSIPANKVTGEDDVSEAKLIVSIKTGIEIVIGIVSILIVMIIIATLIVIRKKGEENE